jgi:hypothetical protein
MLLQMIELEEVTMIEVRDEKLEAVVGRGGITGYALDACAPSLQCQIS